MISSRVSARPRARTSSVAGCLRLRSMRTDRMSRLSVSNSSHAPRLGMTFALNSVLSDALSRSEAKYTPGERTSWETTTRSVPLMMNVPRGVMSGKSPMKTSCSLISPVSRLMKRISTNSGA